MGDWATFARRNAKVGKFPVDDAICWRKDQRVL